MSKESSAGKNKRSRDKLLSQIKEMAAAKKRRKMKLEQSSSTRTSALTPADTGHSTLSDADADIARHADADATLASGATSLLPTTDADNDTGNNMNVEGGAGASTSLDVPTAAKRTAGSVLVDYVAAQKASEVGGVAVAVAAEAQLRAEDREASSFTARATATATTTVATPTTTPPAATTATIDATTWACSSCTYHNAKRCRRCTICKARRPTQEEEEVETEIVQGSRAGGGGGKSGRGGIMPMTSPQSTVASIATTTVVTTPVVSSHQSKNKNNNKNSNSNKSKRQCTSKQRASNTTNERSSSRSSSRSRRLPTTTNTTAVKQMQFPVGQAVKLVQKEEDDRNNNNNTDESNENKQKEKEANAKQSNGGKSYRSKSKVVDGDLVRGTGAEPQPLEVILRTREAVTDPIVDTDPNGNHIHAAAATTTTNRNSDSVQRQLTHENDTLRQMLKDSSSQNSQALLLLDRQQQMLVDFQQQTVHMLKSRQQLQNCLERQQDRIHHFLELEQPAPVPPPTQTTNMHLNSSTDGATTTATTNTSRVNTANSKAAMMNLDQQEQLHVAGTLPLQLLPSGSVSNTVGNLNLDHQPPLSARTTTTPVDNGKRAAGSTAYDFTFTSSPYSDESYKSPAISANAEQKGTGTVDSPSFSSTLTPLKFVSSKATTVTSRNRKCSEDNIQDTCDKPNKPRQLAPPPSPAASTQTIDPDFASQQLELQHPSVTPHATATAMAIERTGSFPRHEQKYAVQAATSPSPAKSTQTIDPDHASQQLWQWQQQQPSMGTAAHRQVVPPAVMPLKKRQVVPLDPTLPLASEYRSNSDKSNQARRVTLENPNHSTSTKRATPLDSRLLGKPAKWQAPSSSSSSRGATDKPPLLNSTNSNRSVNKNTKLSGAPPLVVAASAVASTAKATWISNAPARDFMQSLDEKTTSTITAPTKSKEGIGSTSTNWTKSRRRSHPIAAAATTTHRGDALWDEKGSSQPNYAYKETVRCKTERQGLPCHDCSDCRKFYEALRKSGHEFSQPMGMGVDAGNSNNNSNNNPYLQHSRHRARFTPPETPVDFWEIDFIDEQIQAEKEGRSLDKHV